MKLPKISIITPVYNQVDFVEQTINSVVSQNYPNLEYIIVDGGSTDGTLEIIDAYQDNIDFVISEPDNGMYDALNKGFQISTGSIMGWINSDDILLPGALNSVAKVFEQLPNIKWIHGINSFIDIEGKIIRQQAAKSFSILKVLSGDFKWIQQESTLWHRTLWEDSGGKINTNLKFAGDFELWLRFFEHAKLFRADFQIGGWRKRQGQLSEIGLMEYLNEANGSIKNKKRSIKFKSSLFKLRIVNKLIYLSHNFGVKNPSAFLRLRNKLYKLDKRTIRFNEDLMRYEIR